MKRGYKNSKEDDSVYLGGAIRVKNEKYFDGEKLYIVKGDIALIFDVNSNNTDTFLTSKLFIEPALEDIASTINLYMDDQSFIELKKMDLSYSGYKDKTRISFWDMEKVGCPSILRMEPIQKQ
jgi:hypothetical protein